MFQCQPFIWLKDKEEIKTLYNIKDEVAIWSAYQLSKAHISSISIDTVNFYIYRTNIYDIVLDVRKWRKIKKKKLRLLDQWTTSAIYTPYAGSNK